MTVEAFLGDDASGHLYGPPRELRCLVEGRQRSVRMPDGRVVVAASVIRTDLDYTITTESRLTYRGRPAEVVSVTHFDGGGLPTPDHTEITIQ